MCVDSCYRRGSDEGNPDESPCSGRVRWREREDNSEVRMRLKRETQRRAVFACENAFAIDLLKLRSVAENWTFWSCKLRLSLVSRWSAKAGDSLKYLIVVWRRWKSTPLLKRASSESSDESMPNCPFSFSYSVKVFFSFS